MSGSARRIWLVTRREWDQRARTRAFQVSTIVSVAIVVVLIMVPKIYGEGDSPTRTVGLVGETSAQLPGLLRASGDQLDITVKTHTFADESAGRAALGSDDVSVLLIDQQEFVWKAEADEQLQTAVSSAVGDLDRQQAIGEIGLNPEQAKRLLQPPELRSTSLEPATKEQTARADLGRIGVVVLFMAIAFYCAFVLTGVVEEKSSRVVEVLPSRVRPSELLAGKIFGTDDAEHVRVDRVLVHPGVRLLLRSVRDRRLVGLAPGGDPGAPASDDGTAVRRVHRGVRGDRVTGRRGSARRIAVPRHGSHGDDRPHRPRCGPLVADRAVDGADGGRGLRPCSGGGTDLRGWCVEVRRQGPAA
jgi:hypothetical protein